VGTTDDPADDLGWHKKIAADRSTETRVLPSFRPDRALQIEKEGFAEYIKKLGASAGVTITSLTDLLSALESRIAYFNQQGCKASDHALEYVPYKRADEGEVNRTFQRVLAGLPADPDSVEAYKTLVLAFLASEYHRWHWVMQLHLASIRNINSRMFKLLGPDTGYDAVHDHPVTAKLALFLDHLESQGQLPKTVLYSLNPKDYYVLGTVMGGFQGEGIPGKIQLGSAWWFCDHRDGMEEQMKLLGNLGLLPRFIGMLTDSRSFLSYPRHEYFRRILCNLIGTWAEAGEIPSDPALLNRLVADISFNNAQRYFERS
jgi:glucuronate isomerase